MIYANDKPSDRGGSWCVGVSVAVPKMVPLVP